MRAFLLACVAALVLATVSAAALNQLQQPADHAFATTSVRL